VVLNEFLVCFASVTLRKMPLCYESIACEMDMKNQMTVNNYIMPEECSVW